MTAYNLFLQISKIRSSLFYVLVALALSACGGGGLGQSDTTQRPEVGVVLGTPPDVITSAENYRFNYPQDAVETDDGTIYVAETQSHVIRRIRNGQVEIFAGTSVPGFNGDGDRKAIQLNFPTAITHKDGRLVIADARNYLIRSIDISSGAVKTLAGIPSVRGWPVDNQTAERTTVEYVSWLGYDSTGLLWASMSSESGTVQPPRLYWLDPVSAQWWRYGLPDYPESRGEISGAWIDPGVGVDLLYTSGRFYRLTTNFASSRNMSSIFVGGIFRDTLGRTFLGDHTSILVLGRDNAELGRLPVSFANVTSIKKSPTGGMLVVDSDEGRVLRISPTGETLWSTGSSPRALGVVVSLALSGGKLLALDNTKPSIIALDDRGLASRVAGNGILRWADISVTATDTGFWYPSAIAADSRGNVFVAEQHRIMRIDAVSGQVSLYCGYETAGNVYDVSCSAARFNGIRGLSFDRHDRLYIADTYNNQIKRVSADASRVELLAGNGVGRTFSELVPRFDVDARQSPLNRPHAVRVSASDQIFIADSWNNAVYRLEQGVLRPFAGVPGQAPEWAAESNAPYQGQGEYAGDGGPAVAAKLNTPSDIAVCPNGDILIADEFNYAIRRVSADGLISTVLGGRQGYKADGSLASFLHSVVCDESGFFAADVGNALVWRVGPGFRTP